MSRNAQVLTVSTQQKVQAEAATRRLANEFPAINVDHQELPPELARLLMSILHAMSKGQSVTIQTMPEELTTNQAADMLHMSRPTLMKHIREGRLDAHMVGTHHRVMTADVVAFARRIAARKREEAQAFLAFEDELGLS